jgi:putative ABC transport system permease protein
VYQLRRPESEASAIVIRFQGDGVAAAAAVRGVIAELDPDVLAQPRTIAAIREDAASRFMRLVANVVFLGVVAGVLAIVGIYAVVAFAMSRRTKEIGIRVALGATRADIVRLVMISGSRPVIAGLAAGTVCALLAAQALMKIMANAPVPLEPRNPTTYGAAALLLATAAAAAMMGPAWRAASADPVDALRRD